MKKHLLLIQLLALVIFCKTAFSQGIVSVDPLTGAASASISLTKISIGQVSIPVSLSYRSGLKALDVEGSAGMNWQLNAGGQIGRIVRGLPDDVSKDIAGNDRYGWMSSSNTAAAAISSFSIQNDGVTCSNETSDISAISTNFPFNYDTEPDIFFINAPGISCKMVYDRGTGKFVTISHEDLVITYATDFFTGNIASFTVKDDKGITYVFSALETVKATANSTSGTPVFFATQYKQYQYGINYNSGWHLTSMTDAQGNALNLAYNNLGRQRVGSNSVSLYMPGSTTSSTQYTLDQVTIQPLLSTIKTNDLNAVNQTLTFDWIWTTNTFQEVVSNITGMGRAFSLGYGNVQSAGSSYSRYFLFQVTDYGCATPTNYQFGYGGMTLVSGNYSIPLGDSSAVKMDYWGYPVYNSNTSLQPKVLVNPSNTAYQRYAVYNSLTGGGSYSYSTTNGQDRSADVTQFNVGDLTSITYANGGTTTITYEPNTYKDVPSGQVVAGGGIRVKQMTDYDGIDAAKNIVHNYTYNDPATGVTSGKPVSLPIFAFTIPYSGSATGQSLWDSNTVLSDNDLSNEDHTIMYSYFKVSQAGAGSTLSQFYVPATNWDNSATPICSGCSTADWNPTVNYVGRNNCSSTYGPVGNSSYAYPFIPNPNYDHERGLLQKVTNFNDAGTEVSEESYTYQRPFSPSVLTAFKYDDNPNGSLTLRGYNKYSINYNTAELMSTVTKKVFDSATLTTAQTNTVNYVYGSPNHLLPTQQYTTNSDNSTVTINYKYTKDFSVSFGSNPNVNAIYNLQQQNINTVVERWDQVTRAGTTKTISGNLLLFTGYLPSQQLKFVQPAGTTGFTPYTISGSTQTIDPLYVPVMNYISYDNSGQAQTVDDGNKNVSTTVKDHATSNITATFERVAYNEIGFSDFDTDPVTGQACNFTISGSGSFASNGSHTGLAYGLGTSQTISKTITSRNMKVSNYIFSIWINASSSGTLSFSLSGGGTASATKSFSSGGWKYYEWILPVSAMSSNFTIGITSSVAISVDDILFYPDIARVSTSSYDPKTGNLVAQTNTNGVSTYYKKDQWGRLLFQYDQDKNIVKKQTYITPAVTGLTLSAPYPDITGITASLPTTLTATNTPCLTPVTYTWDFGDGSPTVTEENGYTQQHTYATASTFTVTVTATHPVLGTFTQTRSITTYPPPLVPQVCQSGVQVWSTFTNAPGRIGTCGSNPSDAYNSYYTVTSVTGSGFGTISYTWEISYNNGVTWSTYGTGTQITVPVPATPVPYKVRCNLTSTSGQSATSATLQFSVL